MMYAKLMHRSLFDNIRYPKGKIFEDIGTTYLLFDQCDQVICSFIGCLEYIYILILLIMYFCFANTQCLEE